MMKQSMSMGMAASSPYREDRYLSRYAACIFWMSRYLERAENLCRLLEVSYTFSASSQGEQNWSSVLAIHCDEEEFFARYNTLSGANVIHFYLTDSTHPNSVYACLREVRQNASQLRPVISTEMWVQMNIMFNYIRDLAEKPVNPQDLFSVLSAIRLHCQTCAGITQGGLYRDQGWYFHRAGRDMERADCVTRLLDIKYHLLLPSVDDVGSIIDASQWFALLRAVSGYHAFRREYPYTVTPATVAGFLLLDRRFPRSLACCVDEVGYALSKLHDNYGLKEIEAVMSTNVTLLQQLRMSNIEDIIASGLHEYLDNIQLQLIQMSNHIGAHFF